ESAALLRQDHRLVPVPRQPHGFDQAGFAQVPEVARTGIRRAIIVVAEITTGDHSKGTNGCQRARLRAAARIVTIAVVDELPLHPARQVHMPSQRVTRLPVALTTIAIALGRAGIVAVPMAAV